jgi:hypothetical protein
MQNLKTTITLDRNDIFWCSRRLLLGKDFIKISMLICRSGPGVCQYSDLSLQFLLKIGVLENPLPDIISAWNFLPAMIQKFQYPSLILTWFSRLLRLGIFGNRDNFILLCWKVYLSLLCAVSWLICCQKGRSKKRQQRLPEPWKKQSLVLTYSLMELKFLK